MLIRVEIPVDAPGIDRLLRQVFTGNAEAGLVARLREDGLLTLGIVATDEEGAIIGYVAFSPVTLQSEDRLWVALAPLAVAAAHQRQGVGRALIYEGLDTLNEFGYAAVLVLGDPGYYQPFGFQPATRYHLSCRWPDTQEAFQIYPLNPDSLDGVAGRVEYAPPFNDL